MHAGDRKGREVVCGCASEGTGGWSVDGWTEGDFVAVRNGQRDVVGGGGVDVFVDEGRLAGFRRELVETAILTSDGRLAGSSRELVETVVFTAVASSGGRGLDKARRDEWSGHCIRTKEGLDLRHPLYRRLILISKQ